MRWFARQKARVRWAIACGIAAQAIVIAVIASVVTSAGPQPAFRTSPGPQSAFRLTATPEGGMTSVSCMQAQDCLAVGWKYADNASTGLPLSGRWDGGGWRSVPVPLPAGVFSAQLASVSCTPGGCVAVGTYRIGGGRDYPLAASWDGQGWQVTRPPVPAGGISQVRSAYVNAVSCASVSNCVAVGEYYLLKTNASRVFTESWNGSRWATSAVAAPAAGDATLTGIACPTATTCLAVGSFTPRGSPAAGVLIEALNGGAWTRQPAPAPGGMSAYLEGVSCPSAASCVAVGSAGSTGMSSTPTETAFTEVLTGATWALHAIPVPAGRDAYLSGVSCTSPARCFAVGRTMAHVNHDYGYPYVSSWDGGAWSSVPVPRVPVTSADFWAGGLGSLACTPAAGCVAVGWEGPVHSTDRSGLTGAWTGATQTAGQP